jgi:hypothetical protein
MLAQPAHATSSAGGVARFLDGLVSHDVLDEADLWSPTRG